MNAVCLSRMHPKYFRPGQVDSQSMGFEFLGVSVDSRSSNPVKFDTSLNAAGEDSGSLLFCLMLKLYAGYLILKLCFLAV